MTLSYDEFKDKYRDKFYLSENASYVELHASGNSIQFKGSNNIFRDNIDEIIALLQCIKEDIPKR